MHTIEYVYYDPTDLFMSGWLLDNDKALTNLLFSGARLEVVMSDQMMQALRAVAMVLPELPGLPESLLRFRSEQVARIRQTYGPPAPLTFVCDLDLYSDAFHALHRIMHHFHIENAPFALRICLLLYFMQQENALLKASLTVRSGKEKRGKGNGKQRRPSAVPQQS